MTKTKKGWQKQKKDDKNKKSDKNKLQTKSDPKKPAALALAQA